MKENKQKWMTLNDFLASEKSKNLVAQIENKDEKKEMHASNVSEVKQERKRKRILMPSTGKNVTLAWKSKL